MIVSFSYYANEKKKKKESKNKKKTNFIPLFFLPLLFTATSKHQSNNDGLEKQRKKYEKNQTAKAQHGEKHACFYEDVHKNKGYEVGTKMKSRGLKR